jgi:hypothetical protein
MLPSNSLKNWARRKGLDAVELLAFHDWLEEGGRIGPYEVLYAWYQEEKLNLITRIRKWFARLFPDRG